MAGLSPEPAAEGVSSSWVAAVFVAGAECVSHHRGPALTGSSCLVFFGPRTENKLAGLEAKPP